MAMIALVLSAPGAAMAQELPQSVVITVSALEFSGAVELLSPEDRKGFAADAVGRSLSLAELLALADRVTAFLQQKGLLLARAYLPPQDVTAGKVEVALLAGTLAEVQFNRSPGTRVHDAVLRTALAGKIDSQHVLRQDLESAVLRLNDLPGVRAGGRLEAGAAPGTSRLVIDIDQGPKAEGEFSATNFGGARTGRTQYTLTARLVDLTGRGDETRLQAMSTAGSRLVRLRGSVPVGASGFTGGLDVTHLAYEMVDDAGAAAGLAGTASAVGTTLDGAFIRSRRVNLRAGVGVHVQTLIGDSAAGLLDDKRVLSGTLSLTGDRRDDFGGAGVTEWQIEWTLGNLDLSRVPASEALDAAELQTQGNFQRVKAAVARRQELPGRFSLKVDTSGQWAGKNLDPSLEFELGGPRGVRAYPVGEGRGDEGLLANVELRYGVPVAPAWGTLEMAAFVDRGRIRLHKDPGGAAFVNACGCNEYTLTGAGIGLIWTSGRFSLEASWAQAVGDNPGRSAIDGSNADGGHARQALWVAGTYRF